MSSTNKTNNYELSQFVGTDIPSILVDYNGDMRKIDSAIKEVAIADGENAIAIAELQSETGRLNTEVSEINTNINSISGRVLGIEEKIPANASDSNKLITVEDIPVNPSIVELEETVEEMGADVEAIQLCVPESASARNKLATESDLVGKLVLDIPSDSTTNNDAIALIKSAIVGFSEKELIHTVIIDGNSRLFRFTGLFQNAIHFVFENCSGATNNHVGLNIGRITIPVNNDSYKFELIGMGANYDSSTQEDVPYYTYADYLNENNIGFKVYK